MSIYHKLLQQEGRKLDLPATGSWPASYHLLRKDEAHALIAALASNRPLLVRGEPGVGKSQLARAAACVLGRRFIASVIQPNTEHEELLWQFDHTQRLADAQLFGALRKGDEQVDDIPDDEQPNDMPSIKDLQTPGRYIAPGPVWYALDWETAEKQRCQHNYRPSEDKDAPNPVSEGVVLLIDEIDKADISVSNGLLEVLGNGQFEVRHSGETVRAKGKPPLMVLTTNNTRELPPAMIRRCVILDLALPKERALLIQRLCKVGATHYEDQLSKEDIFKAAERIADDREACNALPRTGQAEFLDLLAALAELPADYPHDPFDELADFFMKSKASSLA
ncbi:MAG: MoxR family ATPase [Sedimenticola sp.]